MTIVDKSKRLNLDTTMFNNMLDYVKKAVDQCENKTLHLNDYVIGVNEYNYNNTFIMHADDPQQGDGCYYFVDEIAERQEDIDEMTFDDLHAIVNAVYHNF